MTSSLKVSVLSQFIVLILFFFFFFAVVVSGLYLAFSELNLKKIVANYLKRLRWIDVRDLLMHIWTIYKLRNKYANVLKAPSTWKRSFWVLVASGVSVALGYFILHCLGQGGGCAGLSVLDVDKVDAKTVSNTAVVLMTAPIVFMIWAFRDANKLREIEQSRKDINLKEFQKLQEWATGNIVNSNESPDEALTLQISALHSLRPYLRGEFGESFKRGAYEIFTSVLKTQHQKLLATFEENQALTYAKIQAAIKKESLTQQINQIAKEEWFNLLVNHNFPTSGISLVGVDLSGEDKYLQHRIESKPLDLSFAQLQGAKLNDAQLQGVILSNAQLNGAKLNGTKLQRAVLRDANLQAAELRRSSMQGAGLRSASLQMSALDEAQMQGAALLRCDLKGASLYGSNLQGADLKYAQLQGVLLNDACLQGADLRNAELQGAVLTDANVQGADTALANLRGVMSQGDYFFDFEGSASRLIVDRSEEPTDVSGLYGGVSEPPMTQEAVNVLEKELLQYRHSTTVSTIIQRIQQGAKKKPPYCDLTGIKRGFYSLNDAVNWTKELEKFQSK